MISSRLRPAVVICLGVTVFVESGCGRKAPPLPPQIRVAEQTRDLRVLQKESLAVVEWSYPSSTTAGGALDDVESIELWRATLPLSQEPRGSTQRDRAMKIQLLEAQGERIAALDAEGRERATRGPALLVEDDLEAWRLGTTVPEDPIIWYAVRTICCGHRESAFSNIARLIPRVPPTPPTWVDGVGTRNGIDLSWQQEDQIMTLVERSPDGEEWTRVTAEPLEEMAWRDLDAAQGASWIYRLRSVLPGEGAAQVHGEPSPSRTVDHPDVYPPDTPLNLVCLPEGSTVRLRWALGAADLGYAIYRQLPGGERELVRQADASSVFADTSPPYGRLTYTVHSVDDAGNLSEPATCETVVGAEP